VVKSLKQQIASRTRQAQAVEMRQRGETYAAMRGVHERRRSSATPNGLENHVLQHDTATPNEPGS
jgi:hypothetical protein